MTEGSKSGATDLTGVGHDQSSASIINPIQFVKMGPRYYGSNINQALAQKGKSRPIPGHVTVFCNICGKLKEETDKKRLVRDHNHKTGYIRGVLCDNCNQNLGVYESEFRVHIVTNIYTKRTREKYLLWERNYINRIAFHLKCNTGIRYDKTGYVPLELLIH